MNIKIDRRYRLEKAVSKDENRVALQNIKIEGNRAIATDGYILADVPIRNSSKSKKKNILLKSKSWKKLVAKEKKNYEVELSESDFTEGSISYPNWKKIVPDGSSHKFKIGIDARLLYNLSQALGADKVILRIDQSDDRGAILVEPLAADNNGEEGLIMLVRLLE